MEKFEYLKKIITALFLQNDTSVEKTEEELTKFIIDYAAYNYKKCQEEMKTTGSTIVDSKSRFIQWLTDKS